MQSDVIIPLALVLCAAAYLVNDFVQQNTQSPFEADSAQSTAASRILKQRPLPPRKMQNTTRINTLVTLEAAIRNISSGGKLVKSSFSNRTRLVFVAGTEGTGHHAISTMFKECRKRKQCSASAALSTALMTHELQHRNLVYGLFGAEQEEYSAANLAEAERQMARLVKRNLGQLYFLGESMGDTEHIPSGQMSYPSFQFRYKVLDHPDAFVLASIAESVGLDFRVLVLTRPARDVIASTERRGFGGIEERKILRDNAAALYSQLSMLDRRFFHCIDYPKLYQYSSEEESRLLNFLHPNQLRSVFGEMMHVVKKRNYISRADDPNQQNHNRTGIKTKDKNPGKDIQKIVQFPRKKTAANNRISSKYQHFKKPNLTPAAHNRTAIPSKRSNIIKSNAKSATEQTDWNKKSKTKQSSSFSHIMKNLKSIVQKQSNPKKRPAVARRMQSAHGQQVLGQKSTSNSLESMQRSRTELSLKPNKDKEEFPFTQRDYTERVGKSQRHHNHYSSEIMNSFLDVEMMLIKSLCSID